MTSLRRDLPLALAALFLWCTGAWAQEHVGDALRIDRSVSAAQGSAVRNLDTGGAVRRTDVLQSDASGRASLQFVDETIVTMGPASSLDVARITLRSDRRATEFVVDAAKGAFRFATGKSSHDAYRVDTPVATLGVRGTQFHFVVTDTQTRVAVTRGAVEICPRDGGPQACIVIRAGQSAQADRQHATLERGLGRIALTAPALVPPRSKTRTPPPRRRTRGTRLNDPDDDRDFGDAAPGPILSPGLIVPLLGALPLIPGGGRGGGIMRGGGTLLKR